MVENFGSVEVSTYEDSANIAMDNYIPLDELQKALPEKYQISARYHNIKWIHAGLPILKYLNNKFNTMRLIFTLILSMSALISHAQLSKIELRATGLTCSMCSNAIFKQLESIAEVDSVETDLNTNTFFVLLKKGNTINPRIFKEKVENAGFFIGEFIATASPETLDQNIYIHTNINSKKQAEIKFQ